MFRSPCHPRNKWWSQEIIFPTAKTAQTWAEAQFTPKTYFWQQVCIISSSIITLPSVQLLRSISVVDKVFSIQGPKSNNLHCQHHHTIPCKTIVEKDTEGNCSTPGSQELRARFFKVFQRPSGIDDKTRNKKKTENLPAKVFITLSIVIWIILTKKKHRIWRQDSKNIEP